MKIFEEKYFRNVHLCTFLKLYLQRNFVEEKKINLKKNKEMKEYFKKTYKWNKFFEKSNK